MTINARAKKIKLVICDVDGVLTDGKIVYDGSGCESKNFDEAKTQYSAYCKMLDQTAAKKIIHVNKASRTKSRLSSLIKKASTAVAPL